MNWALAKNCVRVSENGEGSRFYLNFWPSLKTLERLRGGIFGPMLILQDMELQACLNANQKNYHRIGSR